MEIRALQAFTPPEISQLYRTDNMSEEKALAVNPQGEVVAISDEGVNKAKVSSAVDNLKKFLDSQNQSMEFSIHDVSGQMIVRITNGKTHEVIRQIPSEEIITISMALKKIADQLSRPVLTTSQKVLPSAQN